MGDEHHWKHSGKCLHYTVLCFYVCQDSYIVFLCQCTAVTLCFCVWTQQLYHVFVSVQFTVLCFCVCAQFIYDVFLCLCTAVRSSSCVFHCSYIVFPCICAAATLCFYICALQLHCVFVSGERSGVSSFWRQYCEALTINYVLKVAVFVLIAVKVKGKGICTSQHLTVKMHRQHGVESMGECIHICFCVLFRELVW